jgi:hypothetical protein
MVRAWPSFVGARSAEFLGGFRFFGCALDAAIVGARHF